MPRLALTLQRCFLTSATVLAVAAALWLGVAVPELRRMPADFQYDAGLYSRDDFFDETTGTFRGEVLSRSRFDYETTGHDGDVLAIRNAFEVHKSSGEQTIAVERHYLIDRLTWRHLPGRGPRFRDGYLFAPRGLAGQPYRYWHVNYDAPATLEFQGEDEIQGLRVLHYAADLKADQTQDLGHLPGVPESRRVLVDAHLDVWVEPESGWLVKYADQATAWYHDARTGQRLLPWNRFRNEYTKASIAEQVDRARTARLRARLAGPWGTAVSLLAPLGSCLVLFLLRARASGQRPLARLGALRPLATRGAAVVVGLLGLAVAVGWLTGYPTIAQLVPGQSAMQFNAALGFVGMGLALWAHVAGRQRLQVGSALVVLALAGLTAAEYVLDVDLGIDELIVRSTINIELSHPGRMAPVTAASFLLASLAVLLGRSGKERAVAGAIGSLLAAIGVAAMVGYFAGLPLAYRVGPWASMALPTGFGLAVLGLGLLALSWPGWESRTGQLQVGVTIGVGGLTLVWILSTALGEREEEQIRRSVAQEAERAAERVRLRMDYRIQALTQMAGRWQGQTAPTESLWRADADNLLEGVPGFERLAWLDEGGQVRWEAARLRPVEDLATPRTDAPDLQGARVRARRTGQPVVTGPVDLVPAGRGLVVYVPLRHGNGLTGGFLRGTARFDHLLDVLARESAAEGHAVVLRIGPEAVYQHGPTTALRREWTVETDIDVHGSTWRLALTPKRSWGSWDRSALPEVVLAFGSAIVVLSCLGLALGWQAARQTGRLRQEMALGRQREAQFRDLIEGAPDAIVLSDGAGAIVLVNAQAERLLGYTRAELLGRPVETLVPERFRTDHRQFRHDYAVTSQPRQMGSDRDLTALRKDGSEVEVEISLSPLRSAGGTLVMSDLRDVTERRQAQRMLAQLADELESRRAAAVELAQAAEEARARAEASEHTIAESLHEKEALLREIHHRVKNNMQVIVSLLHMQGTKARDEASLTAFRDAEERVQSMALIHEKLYNSGDLSRIDFGDYASSLATELCTAYACAERGVAIEVQVQAPPLDIERAVPLGLILSEVVSNALKHAFPHDRHGTVRVRLVEIAGDRLELSVSDDGVGLPADFQARKRQSLGLQIVDSLCRQVQGTGEFASDDGTRFTLTFARSA